MLLDIVGLHSGSVEWSQRYAESLPTLFNRLNLLGLGGVIPAHHHVRPAGPREALADRAGLPARARAEHPRRGFLGNTTELKGGVVDDKPLSECEPLRARPRTAPTTWTG